MGFASDLLIHTVVYWEVTGKDGFGKRTFADPVEKSAFWQDKQVLFVDQNGKEVRSESVVIFEEEVTMGSFLCLGEESDLDSSHDDPYQVNGAKEIRGIEKTSDPEDETDFIVKVYL